MLNWKKAGTAAVAALMLAGLTFAAPQKAEAHCYGCGVGAGIIGGLAAGAIIGSAIAGPHYYAPGYYYGAPAYYGPHCWWRRERVWDGYGWRLRRVRVCD